MRRPTSLLIGLALFAAWHGLGHLEIAWRTRQLPPFPRSEPMTVRESVVSQPPSLQPDAFGSDETSDRPPLPLPPDPSPAEPPDSLPAAIQLALAQLPREAPVVVNLRDTRLINPLPYRVRLRWQSHLWDPTGPVALLHSARSLPIHPRNSRSGPPGSVALWNPEYFRLKINRLATYPTLEALLAADAGQAEAATAALLDLLRLAEGLAGLDAPPFQECSRQIYTQAAHTLAEVVGRVRLTETQLTQLQTAFAAIPEGSAWQTSLQQLAARSLALPLSMAASRAQFHQAFQNQGEEAPPYLLTALHTLFGLHLRDRAGLLDHLQRHLSLPSPPSDPLAAGPLELPDPWLAYWDLAHGRFVGLRPGLAEYSEQFQTLWMHHHHSVALCRVAVTLCAVERHQVRHPDRPLTHLAALDPDLLPQVPRDPYTGCPLRYQRTWEGYRIYALGLDGNDEGGAVSERRQTHGDNAPDPGLEVEGDPNPPPPPRTSTFPATPPPQPGGSPRPSGPASEPKVF